MNNSLDIERLASLVRKKRGGRGLREAASQIECVSPSTLSRVENGMMPDMITFLALCDWLEVPASELFVSSQSLTVPESIVLQIRADKNLDPSVANVLAALIKAAYAELCDES